MYRTQSGKAREGRNVSTSASLAALRQLSHSQFETASARGCGPKALLFKQALRCLLIMIRVAVGRHLHIAIAAGHHRHSDLRAWRSWRVCGAGRAELRLGVGQVGCATS